MTSEAKIESEMDRSSEQFIVRARGLPWMATQKDVQKFFSNCNIIGGENGIHFTFALDGRPSGECFIQLASEEDVDVALEKNNQHMGKRYIEVFRSKPEEMDWVIKRMGPPQDKDQESVVRLRGLPYGCSKEEIAQFFTGLEIVPNGITITLDEEGKTTGEAFVEFASPEIAGQAMQKHKETIGHRYIEIFKSCKSEIRFVTKPKPLMSTRPGPYDRMGGFGGPRFGRGDYERRYRGGGRGAYGPVFGGGYNGGFGNDFNSYGGGGRGRGGRGRGGYGRGGGGFGFSGHSSTGHTVSMRGLPFAAKETDIKQFFAPLNPVDVKIRWGPDGRCSGEAEVDFVSHSDAQAAMSKDRQSMGHRYIELFLNSVPDGSGGSGWAQPPNQRNDNNQATAAGGNYNNANMGTNMNYGNAGASGAFNNNTNYSNFGNTANNPQNTAGNQTAYTNQANTGNFGTQGNTAGFGGQQTMANQGQTNLANQPFNQNATTYTATQNTGSFGGQSNTGYGQSGYTNYTTQNTGYTTQQTANYATQGTQQVQASTPFTQVQQQAQQQQQQQPQQQQTGYTDAYGTTGSDSFFGSMNQIKQDPSTQANAMTYTGY